MLGVLKINNIFIHRAPNRVCLKAHRFPLAGFRETNNFINAIGMKFEEYDWWSAQAPTNEQFPGKISTVEKTLAMFVQGNIGVVLMLCEFKLINHEDESESQFVFFKFNMINDFRLSKLC